MQGSFGLRSGVAAPLEELGSVQGSQLGLCFTLGKHEARLSLGKGPGPPGQTDLLDLPCL